MNKNPSKEKLVEEIIINGKRIIDKYVLLNFHRVNAVKAIFPDKNDIAARQYFARMMDRPELVQYLEDKKKRALNKSVMDVEDLVAFLAAVIRVDPLECYTPEGFLKPLDQMTDAARNTIKRIKQRDIVSKDKRKRVMVELEIEFYNKMEAVEKLLKHLGGYEVDNLQRRKAGDTVLNKPQILFQQSAIAPKKESEVDLKLELITKLKRENLLDGE